MQKLNVAIADDNDQVLSKLDAAFQKDDEISVVGTAKNGEEMCRLIENREPDVVLLDLVMPGVDGLTVMERMYHNTSLKNPPRFIVMSAVNNENITSNAFQMGASYYILKPFDENVLINRIKQLGREDGRMRNTILSLPEKSRGKRTQFRGTGNGYYT